MAIPVVNLDISASTGDVTFISWVVDVSKNNNFRNLSILVELQISSGCILILTGDTPLIKTSTLQSFIDSFHSFPVDLAAATLSSFTSNPFGYGRIIRSEQGDFIGIVEQKDATDDQKKIEEINTGIFLVQSDKLFKALNNISNTNAQNEYYLTDIIKILIDQGEHVAAISSNSFAEFQGINTLEELQLAQSTYNVLQG